MSKPYEQTPTPSSNDFRLSIIPVSSEKNPFRPWAEFQNKIAPIEGWHNHFLNQGYIGIICGKVSGNIEVIDVDVKNDPTETIWEDYIKLIPKELLGRLIIQSTPNKGYHLIYRCPEVAIEGNQKLAVHTDNAVIIETRGEGGYICTHTVDYKVIQGTMDLTNLNVNIPIITPQEREQLLEIARSLTRLIQKEPKQFTYSVPAINDFNEQYSIVELLSKHNWSVVKEDSEKIYLLREGSLAPHSAYYFTDTNTLFCYSTSTEFTAGKPYNHFQVLQLLEGKNDYKTTLRLLPELGFPVEGKQEKVTSDDIADYLNGTGLLYDSFIQDLTLNNTVVEERDYNTLYVDMKKHFGKEIARQRFEEVAKSNYIKEVHPILQYVEANKDCKPSGTFNQWVSCLILKNPKIDKGHVLHFIKKWYVGMIAQALDGEYANEFFLTLLSTEQGVGKTTFLRRYTLPEDLQKYRVEHSLSFDDDFKVLMSQSLLIIDDEMDGRTYDAEKTFKNILSIKENSSRRKYDRRISTLKRRCSFAGSGNNLSVVREQQNRRIIPIEISDVDKKMLATINLDDLFMEAYNLYADGFTYSYQKSDRHLLSLICEDYTQLSDVDLILDEYLHLPTDKDDEIHISNLELVTLLLSIYPTFSRRINVPNIGKQMSQRGFKTIRVGKKKISTYIISKGSKIAEYLKDNDDFFDPFKTQ